MQRKSHRRGRARVLLTFVSAALALGSVASAEVHADDGYLPWSEASFTTVLPAPFGRVQLHLRAEPDGRLAEITVTREGASPMHVPPVAWVDVTDAQIGRARMTNKTAFDGTPWVFVHIPYGTATKVFGLPEWPILTVAFRGERAVYRTLNIPKPRGGFDRMPIDLPRE